MKTLAIVLLAALVAGSAAAHERKYVNITGDQLLQCGLEDLDGSGTAGLPFDQGGSCYLAGHIVADVNGQATVTIADDNLSPTSGFYGQDTDGDGSADDATEAIFCGSHALTSGVNWDEGFDVNIWADGPVFGNPVLSVCATLSASVMGDTDHS